MNHDLPTTISPGSLFSRLVQCSNQALAEGALVPIETTHVVIKDQGIPFMVRVATNLKRKRLDSAKPRPDKAGKPFNPFLPPEPPLTVGALGSHHLAILNKFNVVEHHLLMVTRDYEEQERLLNEEDFAVLWRCLDEYPGLGFYNGGTIAGASQHHKHLQYVPLPLLACNCGEVTPMEPLLTMDEGNAITQLQDLSFNHRIVPLAGLDGTKRVAHCHAQYRVMLEQLDCAAEFSQGSWWQSAPYNLLMTRNWMMVVPRSAEFAQGISINGMGFAGSLFVPDADLISVIESRGPMAILAEVSGFKK